MPRAKKPPVAVPLEPIEGPPPFSGTILDAMDIAGLEGSTWEPWRTFQKAVFGLPLTDDEFALYQQHTGRTTRPSGQHREAWGMIGARGGKSTNAGVVGGWLAIRRDYRPLLARGERAIIPIIAADRKQARQILNSLKGFVTQPEIAPYLERPPMATSVLFTTGVTVEVATASYRTTRGYTIPAILADELAFWRSDDSAEPDREILNALRRGFMTMPDPLLLAISTPYARKGELYRACQEHYGRDDDPVLVWNADTLSMHRDPTTVAFVASEFQRDPVFSASEYGQQGRVEFRADVENFIDPTVVQAAIVAGRFELAPVPGTRYVGFTDASGGSQDAWTIGLAHETEFGLVLDVLRERQPPFSPAAVAAEYAALALRYGVSELEGDRYGGEFPRELFRKHGVQYRVADATASELYKECLPLLNAGRVALLDIPRLKTQFCGLERKVAFGGKDTIGHPVGSHDDLANAAAGVLVRAARKHHVTSVRFAI